MACRDCTHFDPSRLDTHGYCLAAPTLEDRSRFFTAARATCWLTPQRFRPRVPAAAPQQEGAA